MPEAKGEIHPLCLVTRLLHLLDLMLFDIAGITHQANTFYENTRQFPTPR